MGTGSYLPDRRVTNADLEDMVRNFDPEKAKRPFVSWAEHVTGIRERRFVKDETAEDMAREASIRALEAAGMVPNQIQFIIACSFTPSLVIPNMACTLDEMLGSGGAGGFALNTACGGFVYGLSMAYSLIAAGVYDTVLVAASEVLSKTIDYGDPKTAVLFGDGAGAVVVGADTDGGMRSAPYSASKYSEHIAMAGADAKSSVTNLCTPEADYVEKTYIKMPGGPNVLRSAINVMAEAAEKALEVSPWNLSDVNCVIPHQANSRITRGLADKMKLDKNRIMDTIGYYGNTSGASIPIALDAAVRGLPEANGISVSRSDILLITAVGGGYSIAAAVMEF